MRASFRGIQVMITSADIAGLLSELNNRGVTIYSVRKIDELSVFFSVRQSQYHKMLEVVNRNDGKIEKCVPSIGRLLLGQLLRRPVLLLGGLLLLIMTIYLPTRILFVTVTGSEQISERKILDAASASGVYFGAARHEIRSEMVKNSLLSALPDLKWVGVNTTGCVAQISVQERTSTDDISDQNVIRGIVAARDGVIREMTIISGNPVCRVGQAVTKGQLLVSGYSDCGRCVYLTRPDAEIYAQTMRTLRMSTLAQSLNKASPAGTKRKYGLLIGKKRINFFKGSGISNATCVRMYMEYSLTLPGGFELPIAMTVQEETDYDLVLQNVETDKVETILQQSALAYLGKHMIAGKVEQGEYQIVETQGALHLDGRYICDEMIGQTCSEETMKEI